jgi:hypothetical protein
LRRSLSSLTKLSPSVSITPLEGENGYLVAATDKYDIYSNWYCLMIRKKGSTKLLAEHEIDGRVWHSFLINQQRQLLFNTNAGILYLQDLNNINNAPKQLFESTNVSLTNIVQTSDGSQSIVCTYNEVIVVENASFKYSITQL